MNLVGTLVSYALPTSNNAAAKDAQTLLPEGLATLITQLSLVSRISLSTSAFFIEALLDSARFTSSASLSFTRNTLIAAISASAASISKNNPSDEQSLAILQRYSQLGCYYIHSSLTLIELFALSGLNLTQSIVQTASSAAVESVKLFDQLFGSTESSRALASIISLVRRELAEDARFQNVSTLASLTKTLTAFVCVQFATRTRVAAEQASKMTVLLDAVVLRQRHEANEFLKTGQVATDNSLTNSRRLSQLFAADDPVDTDNNETFPPAAMEAVLSNLHEEQTNDIPEDVHIDRTSVVRGNAVIEIETITTKETRTTIRIINEAPGDESSDLFERIENVEEQEQEMEERQDEWVALPSSAQPQSSVYDPGSTKGRKKLQVVLKSMSRKLTTKKKSIYDTRSLSENTFQPPSPSPSKSPNKAKPSSITKMIQNVKPSKTKSTADAQNKQARQRQRQLSHLTSTSMDSDQPSLRRRQSTSSIRTMHSVHTHYESRARTFMELEPLPSNFPRNHIINNIHRYVKFASAAYGQTFLRLMKMGDYSYSEDANHHCFCHHTGIKMSNLRLTSFMEPIMDNTKSEKLVHYLAIDDEAEAVVLACRGSLGLSDILTDLTAEYKPVHLQYAPKDGSYFAHRGMLEAAQNLVSRQSTVHEAIRKALLDNPGYGLVLAGHSLGAGVCSLLAALLASPTIGNTQFVTSPESGLPSGRPIHAYGFGTPAVVSPDLARYCAPFLTTIVHNNDFVCTLSLGVLHDLKDLALAMNDEPNLAHEVVGRVTGLYRPKTIAQIPDTLRSDYVMEVSKTDLVLGRTANEVIRTDYQDPFTVEQAESTQDQEISNWLWSLRQTMRAVSVNDKFTFGRVPPGRVFVVEVQAQYVAYEDGDQKLQKEADRVILRRVDDVAFKFAEPHFSKNMLFDHSPHNYESAISILHAAVSP